MEPCNLFQGYAIRSFQEYPVHVVLLLLLTMASLSFSLVQSFKAKGCLCDTILDVEQNEIFSGLYFRLFKRMTAQKLILISSATLRWDRNLDCIIERPASQGK